MSIDWYYDLMYCGASSAIPLTGATLNQAQQALVSPPSDANLDTLLDSTTDTCSVCALDFANSIQLLREDPGFISACGDIAATWATTKLGDLECLDVLYEPITAFNECTGNGYDLFTFSSNIRCTTEEFVLIDRLFRPWGPMIAQALDGVSVEDYASSIDSHFASSKADSSCGSCFDDLYDNLVVVDCVDSAFDSACLAATQTVRDAFAVCTGGFALNVDMSIQCTAAEGELFGDVYRPYFSYVKCASDEPTFFACVDENNGIEDTVSSSCDPCFGVFQTQAAALMTHTCSLDPFSTACVEIMDRKDGPVSAFEICTGFELSTDSTRCTAPERSDMVDADHMYPPMLIAAKSAADLFAAGNLLEDSADLQALTVGDVTCTSCYRAFIGDAFIGFNAGSFTDCEENIYSDSCATAIAKILDRFTTCSSITLTADSPNICTATQMDRVTVFDGLDALLVSGNSVAVAEEVDSLISDTIPCKLCFVELARAAANQSVCVVDVYSVACTAALAGPLAAFESCSGNRIDGAFTTTTTSTTLEATTATTETTTTTKASAVNAAGFALIWILLNL